MPAGKLRHRVTFQRPDGEGEREGERVTDQCLSWQDVATRSAQVRPVSVKEIYAAGGFLGQTDLVVTVRYDPVLDDLDNTWRIYFQNRHLYVVGMINPDMRDRWLNITTTREQGDMRLKNPDFDQPLHDVVNVVMPELT